jgi:DNA-binding protein HU-beta
MNKVDLVSRVANVTGDTKSKVGEIVEATFGALQQALAKGDKVSIPGFGTFSARARKARTARNPRTGAAVKVPATKVPAFKAAQGLKEIVSGKAKPARKASAKKKPAARKPAAKKTAAKKTAAKKKKR